MNAVVSPRITTIALIAALSYEMVLKLSHLMTPAAFGRPGVTGITTVLSGIIGIIIILFLISFYREERAQATIARLTALTIGVVLLQALLRLPMTRGMMSFQMGRLAGFTIGAISSCLLFLLILNYLRVIPSERKTLKQAAALTSVLLGIGAMNSLYSLGCFIWFMISLQAIEPSPLLRGVLFILFLLTHASMILFLIRYRQFKSTAMQTD